jgi:TPR repeat protein
MQIEGRLGVAKDVKQAFKLAKAGAALGCAHSKGALSRCYVYGQGVAANVRRGVALGRESEAAGSCFVQYVVGVCYYNGQGVAQDHAEAMRLYRLAAAQGHAQAQGQLGGHGPQAQVQLKGHVRERRRFCSGQSWGHQIVSPRRLRKEMQMHWLALPWQYDSAVTILLGIWCSWTELRARTLLNMYLILNWVFILK